MFYMPFQEEELEEPRFIKVAGTIMISTVSVVYFATGFTFVVLFVIVLIKAHKKKNLKTKRNLPICLGAEI